jgi:hypothetical protein
LFAITLAGLLLAVMMTWEGLFIRVFSEIKDLSALWFRSAVEIGINPHGLAWPWIVLGISWIGALAGLWLRLSWGKGAVTIISILSLIYVGIGTFLAAIALLCILLPSSKCWIAEGNV